MGVTLKTIAPPLPKPRKLKQAKDIEDKESVKSEVEHFYMNRNLNNPIIKFFLKTSSQFVALLSVVG